MRSRWLGLFAIVFALVAPLKGPAAAIPYPGDAFNLSPFWDWKRLETEHFRVNFPDFLAQPAQKAAVALEQAHELMAPLLRWEPFQKVEILVLDNTDLANGLTSAVGRFGILLYVTPPENWSSLAYYDDWLRLLVIHEYAHYLNLDATAGWYTPLRSLFGDVLLPNSIWPMWMLEGLATYMETRFTKGGRGRGAYYDAVLRSAVQAGTLDTPEFITLDRINGPNPYYPGGETAYLFGYQLMNQLARQPLEGRTADGLEPLADGEDAIGIMSARSSGRLPFLINSNLENIVGKDWYALWTEWVRDTQRRATQQLKQLHAEPLTPVEFLTENTINVLGSAVSPDGRWLAYTADSLDRRGGLHLRELATGQVRRLRDKFMGANVSFTPDSRYLLYSRIDSKPGYDTFTDLEAYDLVEEREIPLTEDLRARDPNVSSDGQWVAFTLTRAQSTVLARAELRQVDGALKLGEPEVLFPADAEGAEPQAAWMDVVSGPRFTADGQAICFSLHRSGQPQEDLLCVEVATRKVRTLVSDGHYNRYPVFASSGELYYVSDLTGVDNLYRYREGEKPELVTNVATAVAFPSLAAEPGVAHAALLTSTGWRLARLQLASQGLPAAALTVEPPPAPTADARVERQLEEVRQSREYPVSDYSVWPSILPRQWGPFVQVLPDRVYFGADVLGFDAVDQHRYFLLGTYDTFVRQPEMFARYDNRTLGPTISLSLRSRVADDLGEPPAFYYEREVSGGLSVSHTFAWTYSSLTPWLGGSWPYRKGHIQIDGLPVQSFNLRRVPELETGVYYTNAESSRLAVSPERGFSATAAVRRYLDPDFANWKALLAADTHLLVLPHTVLTPSVRFSTTSGINPAYADANVRVDGRSTAFTDFGGSDSLDLLRLRGYDPPQAFQRRSALVLSGDLVFPLARVFRGAGTDPAFLEDVTGFAFVEAGVLVRPADTRTLPSAGGGIRLDSTVLVQIPLNLTIEYRYGFRKDYFGKGEFVFQASLGQFLF